MLLTIQYPIADSRAFFDDFKKTVLLVPEWPSPKHDTEFVRFFGKIKKRKGDFLKDIGGEDWLCNANKAIRFQNSPLFKDDTSNLTVGFKVYRHFYHDGNIASKFELSIENIIPSSLPYSTLSLNEKQTDKLIRYFFDINCKVPKVLGNNHKFHLYEIGDYLSKLYLYSSLRKNYLHSRPYPRWLVEVGTPIFIMEIEPTEHIDLQTKNIAIPNDFNFSLGYSSIEINGRDFPLWKITLNESFDYDKKRYLRLCLMRLNAQYECLRLVLSNIRIANLIVSPRSKQSQILQRYFKIATGEISLYENKTSTTFHNEILDLARNSVNLIREEDVSLILETLESFDIRPNWYNHLEGFMKKEGNINIFTGVTKMGDTITVGDGSNLVNRSIVQDAFKTVKDKHDEEIANALLRIEEAINKSGNKDAAENFESFSDELAKPEPKKSILKTLWQGTLIAMPALKELTAVVEQIVKLFS